MKVKVLNTLKSGSDIIPAGQILTDDEIPAFIVKLAEAKSEHVAVLPDDVVEEEEQEKEPEGEKESEDSAEDGKESVEDHSEEASTEEKTPKKRK